MEEIYLLKRNGTKEVLMIEKIRKVLEWACTGVSGVSASEIESQARLKFFQGMKTSDLHASLISATHELICEDTPNFDLVAGRLLMFDLRKRAFGQYEVPRLYDLLKDNTESGWYHKDLIGLYTEQEWDKIESFVDHNLDLNFKISGAREWADKYLVKNRSTGEYKESPQVAYVLISALLMHKYKDVEGLSLVKEYYEDLSNGTTSIPSPITAGVRTPYPQGASCVVIEADDNLSSITATVDACVKYASNKAGLGVGIYNLRAEKQPVRGGAVTTTGPIPFGQLIASAISSCSQGGIRKGSGTLYHTIWHKDVCKLLVLKNNRGTEETRIRHMDHAFNINGFLLRKILKGEPIALFSPETVPDLTKAFYDDQDEFERLYEIYAKDESLATPISGDEIRKLMVNERGGTSRIYFHFVDNTNEQGTFIPSKAPVRQSNLCLEITLPTIPLQTFDDPDALISLCTLSAINWAKIKKPADFERVCRNAVFALDSLLDYQPYLLKAAHNSTKWYRPLGIGTNNLAYFLAKRGLKYNKDAFEVVDEYSEAQAYYLTKASIELAKRYGPCEKYQNTKYSLGIVPHDVRKKAVDELIPHIERLDWATIRSDLKQYGIRNATLSSDMPAETSSRVHGMTNGDEPLRNGIVTKSGTKQVAPEYSKLKNKYDYEFDMDLEGYIMLMAVKQKRMCQAISLNTRYDPTKYPNNQIPAKLIIRHIGMIYRYGLKTAYYQNNKKVLNSDTVEGVEVTVIPKENAETLDESQCESCAI